MTRNEKGQKVPARDSLTNYCRKFNKNLVYLTEIVVRKKINSSKFNSSSAWCAKLCVPGNEQN